MYSVAASRLSEELCRQTQLTNHSPREANVRCWPLPSVYNELFVRNRWKWGRGVVGRWSFSVSPTTSSSLIGQELWADEPGGRTLPPGSVPRALGMDAPVARTLATAPTRRRAPRTTLQERARLSGGRRPPSLRIIRREMASSGKRLIGRKFQEYMLSGQSSLPSLSRLWRLMSNHAFISCTARDRDREPEGIGIASN